MYITINPEKLWIAAQFQSKEQTRYYLCGVYIEPAKDGATITATDGHRLVTCHDTESECSESALVTITKETMRALKKADSVIIDDGKLTVYKDGAELHVHPGDCRIDGTFPDWRRIVPRELSGELSCGFDPKYLGDFAALFGFQKSDASITIYQNGKSGTIVSAGSDDVFAVLMPKTNKTATAELPDWLGIETAEEKAA